MYWMRSAYPSLSSIGAKLSVWILPLTICARPRLGPLSSSIARMQATHAWSGPIERMPTSKRELWFTLIRVIVLVALIGTAARFVAIAYAPQWAATSEQLNCPTDAVTDHKTVVTPQVIPPQVLGVSEQSATSVTSGDGLANKSDLRSKIGKKEEHRREAKKPPTYAFARNGVSQKRAATGKPVKRGWIDVNHQQKWEGPALTLAHSAISPPPFGDMHGQ